MAVLIQKHATNLSTMHTGGECYECVFEDNLFPDNTGGSTVGYISITTSGINIHFTPTKSGNLQGVMIMIYNTYYSKTTQRGILIEVALQENVSGTWTDRVTKQHHTDRWIVNNTYTRMRGILDFRFDIAYPIDTTANKWRIQVREINGGGGGVDSGTFYIMASQDMSSSNQDGAFFIPYIDNTVALTDSDVLVLTDKVTVDEDLTLGSKYVIHDTQSTVRVYNRYYSVYSTVPVVESGAETEPQLYVPHTISSDIAIDFDGSVYMSAFSTALKVGSKDNPIPYNWENRSDTTNRKVSVLFSRQGTNQQTGFLGSSGHENARYGGVTAYEMWGTIPPIISADIKENINVGDTSFKVIGDVTTCWAPGDNIQVGGGQYSDTRQLHDYTYMEYKEIDSLSYDAANDETTITVTTSFSYLKKTSADMLAKVTLATRHLSLGGTPQSSFNIEAYFSGRGLTFKLQGVQFHNVYYQYMAYLYKKMYNPATFEKFYDLMDGCNIHESYYPMRFYVCQNGVTITGNTASRISSGTTASRIYYAIQLIYTKEATVEDNVFTAFINIPLYIYAGGGHTIKNNYFSHSIYTVQLANGTANNLFENNQFYKCRVAYYFSGGSSNVFKNNKFRQIYYDTNYSQTTETTHGVYCYASNYSNVNNISYNDDADDAFVFVNGMADMFATHTFIDANFNTNNFIDGVVNESGANYRPAWIGGTEFRFENFDGRQGVNKHWFTNGYFESTGTGLDDTEAHTTGEGKKAWRMNTYFEDTPHTFEFTIPVGVPNEPIGVSIYVKVAPNYSSGNYVAPYIEMEGLGVTGQTVKMEADVTNNDWQLLQISGTPTKAGNLTVRAVIQTDQITNDLITGLNTDGNVYWDDIYISYKTPIDLGGLDLTDKGFPIFPPLSTSLTASQVWAEQTALNNVSGSFGEAVNVNSKIIKWLRSLL